MTLEEVLDQHGIEVRRFGEHHHVSRGWLGVDCPFCSPGAGSFRLGIEPARLRCSCWVCGWHPFVKALTALGVPHQAASKLFGGRKDYFQEDEAPRGILVEPRHGPLLPAHRRYLAKRGFDPDEIAERWKVGGIGVASRLQWRLYIPAMLGERVVSWTTRSISDKSEAKYVSARRDEEAVSLKSILYGEQFCRHAIVVVEGPLDAWTIGPGAVATCGIGHSQTQVSCMSMYPVRVICFDNEPEAQRRAKRLCTDLSVFDGQTYNVVLSGKDASRSPQSEILDIRERFLR